MLAGPVFCACALTAMTKNFFDARWTVKAKFDDLYPLLFVMVFGCGLGVGAGGGGGRGIITFFFIKLRFLHCSLRHAAQTAGFAKLTKLT